MKQLINALILIIVLGGILIFLDRKAEERPTLLIDTDEKMVSDNQETSDTAEVFGEYPRTIFTGVSNDNPAISRAEVAKVQISKEDEIIHSETGQKMNIVVVGTKTHVDYEVPVHTAVLSRPDGSTYEIYNGDAKKAILLKHIAGMGFSSDGRYGFLNIRGYESFSGQVIDLEKGEIVCSCEFNEVYEVDANRIVLLVPWSPIEGDLDDDLLIMNLEDPKSRFSIFAHPYFADKDRDFQETEVIAVNQNEIIFSITSQIGESDTLTLPRSGVYRYVFVTDELFVP